ncbi:MAG: 3-dehydroquinate synthase, partial [Desulfobacca sp.]|nr:3-dehydroquinate synthase [Desulfobacca sp.]
MNRIRVNLDTRASSSYEIYIGQEIIDRVGVILNKSHRTKHFVILTDSQVGPLHGTRVLDTLRKMDLKVDLIHFPAGETSKNIQTCLQLVDQLIALGADRYSSLIALGGGVVGDLTGFIASIYMRGIPFFQIPTTLMAQVDSSIGGKTGIDLSAGKNLLGTFYQPQAVFIDLTFLQTLNDREFNSGLSEILKYGIIEGPELFRALEEGISGIKKRDPILLEKIITKSCRIKKRIVEMDEKESGLRRILNFGHTIGHAVEAESRYTISHGEGVAIGMVCAALLSEKLKYLNSQERGQIESLVKSFGLPHTIPNDLETKALLARMRKDKKKQGQRLPLVLLKKIGLPFINGTVPETIIQEAIEA